MRRQLCGKFYFRATSEYTDVQVQDLSERSTSTNWIYWKQLKQSAVIWARTSKKILQWTNLYCLVLNPGRYYAY